MRKIIIMLLAVFITGNASAQGLTPELMSQAEAGDPLSMCNVGICYKNGLDCEKNYEKMLYWFNKAAEKNEHNAMYNLGCIYDFGIGVNKNPVKALQWYRKSAERNNKKAMYNLACCLHEGIGTSADNLEAAYWFKKSAVNGNVKAMEKLYLAYLRGDGLPQSIEISELIKEALNMKYVDEAEEILQKAFPDFVIK